MDDHFGDLTPEEVALRFRKYAHSIAFSDGYEAMHDDLVQEALIAVWRTAKDRDGEPYPATYYAKAAKGRIHDVAWRRRPWTGGDSTPGPKSRPSEVHVDWSEDGVAELLNASVLLEDLEWAYHEGDFAEALSGLSERDREYVFRKYWGGQTDTEIGKVLGVTNKYLGNRWTRVIKPQLQQALAHLAM